MNTGTLLSKTIRFVTRYKYSHVVLSLDNSFKKLYSFGRKKVHNFLDAGFVTYGVDSDFFKVFDNTECVVYEVKISEERYEALKQVLAIFEEHSELYHYDIKGLLLRYFYPSVDEREYYYVCSQFVASVLENAEVHHFDKPPKFVKPHDFTQIPDAEKIYEGRLDSLGRGRS